MKKIKSPKPDFESLMPLLIEVWRRYHKLPGPPDRLQTREFRRVVEAVLAMQDHLGYGSDREKLGSYLLYYWPIHFQQGLSLIGELPNRPRRVLDVCAGLSPFAFAALRHGAGEVYATDKNYDALLLGNEVIGRSGYAIQTREWDCLKSLCPIEGTFDLIILGHSLYHLFPENEAGSTTKQIAFLDSLLNKLTKDGCLLLVEDSLPAVNRGFLEMRELLQEKGVTIQAPCIWQGKCPALSANSQCFAQREFEKPFLLSEIQRSARIRMESIKMSYLILRSPQVRTPNFGDQKLYRIISPPFESFQGKSYYLCGTDGKRKLSSKLPNHPKQSRSFEYLRRGDLISLDNTLDSRNTSELNPESSLQIKAPAGKPIPHEGQFTEEMETI